MKTVELTVGGGTHHVTVPRHADIRVGDAERNQRRCRGVPLPAQARGTRHALRLTTDEGRGV